MDSSHASVAIVKTRSWSFLSSPFFAQGPASSSRHRRRHRRGHHFFVRWHRTPSPTPHRLTPAPHVKVMTIWPFETGCGWLVRDGWGGPIRYDSRSGPTLIHVRCSLGFATPSTGGGSHETETKTWTSTCPSGKTSAGPVPPPSAPSLSEGESLGRCFSHPPTGGCDFNSGHDRNGLKRTRFLFFSSTAS
jgi:hypothetical protein